MICEKCNCYILNYLDFSDFMILCDKCKNKVIAEKEKNFQEKIEGLIDRVSEGLTEIEDE